MFISDSLLMAEQSEPKSAKLSFASKYDFFFDAKLRLTRSASLRSAIVTEIEVDNNLVTLPTMVKCILLKITENLPDKIFALLYQTFPLDQNPSLLYRHQEVVL